MSSQLMSPLNPPLILNPRFLNFVVRTNSMISIASIAILLFDTYRRRNFKYRPALQPN